MIGSFFRGRQRQIGVATLMLACVLSVGWVRSLQNLESLHLNLWQVRSGVISVDGHLGIYRVSIPNPPEKGFVWVTLPIVSVYGSRFDKNGARLPVDASTIFNVRQGNGNEFLWRWQFFRFDCGKIKTVRDSTLPFFFVPYWSITVPLTLVSTFLLIRKPRQSTLKKIHDFQNDRS